MKRTQRMTRRQDLQEEMEYNKRLIQEEMKNKENMQCQKKESNQKKPWGFSPSCVRKIQIKPEIIINSSIRVNDSQPIRSMKNWNYTLNQHKIKAKPMSSNCYYPPNCSGYDMAYCKAQKAIYVYGGIPCSGSLNDGIKAHFYKFSQGKWSEVKVDSTYNPPPRYGHTFTAFQKDLILFGGVSQYKEKLKDRCFYTDCSAFSTTKNNWRMIETSGMNEKTRKNHSATVYGKYYLVYGGLDESEEVISELSWVNLQQKKSRWKSFSIPGRFNHKMVAIEPTNGKDFLCIFGGRNSQSQIINSMFFVPICIYEGDFIVKEPVEIQHTIKAREMPIMGQFLQGFVILGGINQENEVVEDCWYCNNDKQTFTKIWLDINFEDLRGAKSCPIQSETLYIMTGNSQNYKALQILCQK